jgi:BirA family transcriptional regulator, biotin operon repressor / biotin---[acetyl-CoA-carboxylase] ligase
MKELNIRYISFDTIDSTQLWVKKNAAFLKQNELTCIAAKEQTAGIGQHNRKWISPRQENIYATLYFTLPKPCLFLPHLSQLLSLSCAIVLKAKGFDPTIKRPNDILLANRKVAGILCDVIEVNNRFGIILGIGINVNMGDDTLEIIDQPATSLRQISGKPWNMDEILTPLLFQLLDDLESLYKEGLSSFEKRYTSFIVK